MCPDALNGACFFFSDPVAMLSAYKANYVPRNLPVYETTPDEHFYYFMFFRERNVTTNVRVWRGGREGDGEGGGEWGEGGGGWVGGEGGVGGKGKVMVGKGMVGWVGREGMVGWVGKEGMVGGGGEGGYGGWEGKGGGKSRGR